MFKNYLLLTKPGILCGNLMSAAAGFFLASRGNIDTGLFFSTIIGTSLVVASGCVFNNYIDRNMDRKMMRTRNRALARGLLSHKGAITFGSALGVAGTTLLWWVTNTLSVAIVLAGFAIYVGAYSLYLKRNSVLGTLVGSLAGAAPPLGGYCAAGNGFDTGALILFSIFTLWQMPHCYAIAIFRLKDYTAAAIPVLPVTQGITVAKKHMIAYIFAFIAVTLMLTFGGYTGYRYLSVAAVMGLSWLYMAWAGYRTSDVRLWAKRLFVFSVVTIFALNIMMSIDFTVPSTQDTIMAFASSFNSPQ